MLTIVSWNILQGGGKRAQAIGDALSRWAADILILQEYRPGGASQEISVAVNELGLVNQHFNTVEAGKNCVFLASKQQIQCEPWTDKLDARLAVHATVKYKNLDINLMAAHMPHKRKQIPYFEALLDEKQLLSGNALIIGDLNCGIPFEDSDTKTFDNTHLFQALLQQGWIDSWRSRHADAREFTWISHKGNGYRYDHCLSSAELDERIVSVQYDHEVRESGLSDHSALIVHIST